MVRGNRSSPQSFIRLLLLALALAGSPSLATPVQAVDLAPSLASESLATASADGLVQLSPVHVRPKIVVFWASLGFGHLSASRAIEADIKKAYPEADVVLKDLRDFKKTITRKLTGHFYDQITKKTPTLYDIHHDEYMDFVNRLPSVGDAPSVPGHNPDRVLEFLGKEKPTLIISTYNHASEVLVRLRDEGYLKDIPVAQVLTDYVDMPMLRRIANSVEMSFVPDESIRASWIANGVPADRVLTSGIPVGPSVSQPLSDAEREAFLIAHGLQPDVKTALLVSGSAGVGNFSKMVKSMAKAAGDSPIQIVAVTAKNQSHFDKLTKLEPKLPPNVRLKVLGLTPHEELMGYMKSADVIIAKTGGLTSSEIAALNKPFIALDINGGQESHNSRFFAQRGMAFTTRDQGKVGQQVMRILGDPEVSAKMVAAQQEFREELGKGSGSIPRWVVSVTGNPAEIPANFVLTRQGTGWKDYGANLCDQMFRRAFRRALIAAPVAH